MFEFCIKELRLGEGEAFRRILASRLARRFPVVYSLLASGAVNLSTLELVREWLTEDNHQEVLAAVVGKSKREVQAYVASRFPRPDRPSRIRRTMEPLSGARFAIEFTASDSLREKLELCLDLMSHTNPNRDLAVVVERAVDLLLPQLQRKRLAPAKRPRDTSDGAKSSASGITNATRRAVFERDGTRCTYVADDGRRCEARAFLELDHAVPKGLGGTNDAHNLRVRCRAHNQLWAEQVFGRERMETDRHFRQKKSEVTNGKPRTLLNPNAAVQRGKAKTFDKVRSALRRMGFREAEAARAVATVSGMHNAGQMLDAAQVLREAVLVATAA